MSMRLNPQPDAVHGGATGVAIDLSASLNPLGPSGAALAAAHDADMSRYPSVDAEPLRIAAATRHRVDPGAVVPVPGASWGIWLCATAFLTPGDRCLAFAPCFSEYRRCAEIAGAQFSEWWTAPPEFLPVEADVIQALADEPAVCFICNPGNPTGALMPAAWLRRVCDAHPKTLFVVDEAFIAFAPAGASLLDAGLPPTNIIVLRSLTKELGLPGLRMGYVVADPDLASALGAILPPWPLSAPSIAAAVAGIADQEHVDAGADLARRHVEIIAAALREAGAEIFPTRANYLMARAPGLAAFLLERGIAARDCTSFGLAGHVRISAPRVDELEPVLAALRALLVPAAV
jgi:histidinol-phosphate/aromatic aminotransferase/cobyric acid decarboxylase-like protein